jgi:hypothetical protein
MTLKATIHITREVPSLSPYGSDKKRIETIVDLTDSELSPRALAALLEGVASEVDPQIRTIDWEAQP